MSPTELILNFVNLYNHPFTADLAAEMTAQDISLVQPILDRLYSDQTIKLISPEDGIYVRNNRYNPVVGYKQKGEWRFDPAAARSLLDHIEIGKFYTIREVAKDYPRSRQWVYVYMEALASIDILGFSADGYCVKSRDRLNDLGMNIIKGAICKIYNDYYATSHKTNRPPSVRKVDEDKLRLRQEKLEQRRAIEKAKRKAHRDERDRMFELEKQKIARENQKAWDRLAKQCEALLTKFKTQ
ncbi:MAG: hypothetical protein Q8M98_01220 [Candidatus Cloacimonadaceae bacterium]|nr:hypothetical protein [Candidatus Cloacimonadaceae bacterium]MDP3113371.1 hypothetical protein [Candidatus Cloacimonadaceae bacterium]